ncbi:MAG: hypothetical protein JSS95_00970 [Acidobacteria bacterium]|nr:hypothetical protein [Acidobacteriota bacterium]
MRLKQAELLSKSKKPGAPSSTAKRAKVGHSSKARTIFGAVLLAALTSIAGISQQPVKTAQCRVGVLEGQLRAGESFVRPIGGGLELMLEPLAAGWILRVLPEGKPRPAHDYAELATPPYHSVSPLLISTDFSFRAQDAVGWNPRRFRFAANEMTFSKLLKAYNEYEANPSQPSAAQQNLAALVSQSPEAMLTILDAHLVPGTADQARTAATVAAHFLTTPHTVENPSDGRPTSLGRLTWIRFRIALDLPQPFKASRDLKIEQRPCIQ